MSSNNDMDSKDLTQAIWMFCGSSTCEKCALNTGDNIRKCLDVSTSTLEELKDIYELIKDTEPNLESNDKATKA